MMKSDTMELVTEGLAFRQGYERFRALFDHSPDAIMLLMLGENDKEATIVDCNDVACRMNGYSREELIGQPVSILNDYSEGGALANSAHGYVDYVREHGKVTYEALHRRKDGTIFPIEVSTCVVTVDGQELILGIDRDISERRRMEAVAKEERQLAEALSQASATLNASLNLNDVFDQILDQAARVVPHDASSIALIKDGYARIARCRGFEQRNQEDYVLTQQFKVDEKHHYLQMVQTLKPLIFPDVRQESDWVKTPETDWIRGHITTPIIVEGQVIGFLHLDSAQIGAFTAEQGVWLQAFANHVAIALQNAQHANELERRVTERTAELLHVIAERERMEIELRFALERERELSDLKNRFIASTSHEFRTPLAVILTASDLLKRYYTKMTDDQRSQRLDHIQGAVHRLTTLISDVFAVSQKTGSSSREFERTCMSVVDFCQPVLDNINGLFPNHKTIAFTHVGACDSMLVDQHLLADTLTHLLSNAMKYTHDEQSVTLDVVSAPNQIVFTVRDQGIGIPEADQARIFEVFHRGANVGSIAGTGLGLTIAKQLAEIQGGRIDFESQVGVGTMFKLTIPNVVMKDN